VAVTGLHDSDKHPHKVGANVHPGAKQLWSQSSWEDIGHDDFDGVSVLRGDGHSDVVLMMDLVNVGVQLGVMEGSVSPIEGKVFDDHAEEHLQDDLANLGEAVKIKPEFQLIKHNVAEEQGRSGQQVEEGQCLEGFLKHDAPLLGVALPRPSILKNSVSLKEWDFHGVNEVHNDVSDGEDREMTSPAKHDIDLTIGIPLIKQRSKGLLEYNRDQVKEADCDRHSTDKTVAFAAIPHLIVLEDLLHGVIGGTGTSRGMVG
jgi:hypothetical protein